MVVTRSQEEQQYKKLTSNVAGLVGKTPDSVQNVLQYSSLISTRIWHVGGKNIMGNQSDINTAEGYQGSRT